jgi:3-isopropylmalate/(R)-2-methylmalate dehydratase small subunit
VGRVFRFGANLNTDHMIAGKYKHATMDLDELATHFMEGLRPGLAEQIRPGDFLVGDRNFGCGSSREQAPRVAQRLGVRAVVAPTFARIFLRNAVNIGLLPLICETDEIAEGDNLEFNAERWVLRNQVSGREWHPTPLPSDIAEIIGAGGLVALVHARGAL